MSLDGLVGEHRIVVCAGPGGVGKTTAAAALGLGMAARGLRVAVVTIDPARRLADALGLDELGDEPTRVAPERLAAAGREVTGELWAMTLDAKRTFDRLIERLAPDERTRDEVLGNRIYAQLSDAVAGSQEFSAVAKLHELDAEGGFDLIVLDTPPSRNALDFLEAPDRLTHFFEGRAVRMFLRPAGLGGRLLGRGTGVVFGLLKRVTGVDLLDDLSVFFRSLSGMIDGFAERARRVRELLEDPGTAFVLVSSGAHDPVEETVFFAAQLDRAGLALGGLVVNRFTHPDPAAERAAPEEVAALLDGDERLAGRVLRAAGDRAGLARRDAAGLARLREALAPPHLVVVAELGHDVADLAALAEVLDALEAGG